MNWKQNAFARLALPSAIALLTMASVANAHTGHIESPDLVQGFMHPFSGLDHILAMLAVGLWATQLSAANQRAIWLVPVAFIDVMMVGGLLGANGVALPGVEVGILASVLILGVLIAASVRLPLAASMAIVGAFALFHGFDHGASMPATVSGLTYGVGFINATILLHAAGIGLAMGAQKLLDKNSALPLRFAGAAISLGGLLLMVS